MIQYSSEKLQFYLEAYTKELPSFWEDEKYKWEAVQWFQDNWNIDSPDFQQMFTKATEKHINLLDSGNYFPLGMLQEFIALDAERVRQMFKVLYNENVNIVDRISQYKSEAEYFRLINPEKWNSNFQDPRAISVFLWMRYPEKYYIYKYTELKKALELIGADVTVSKSTNPEVYVSFLEIMNTLCLVISQKEDLVNTLKNLINKSSNLFPDQNFHTATADFIFYVGRRYKGNDEVKEDEIVNNTMKEQFKEYLSSCVLSSQETYTSKKLGPSAVNSYASYADADKLFDYAPEQWQNISSIYDITSSQDVLNIIEKLFNDEAFKNKDKKEKNKYFRSNGIKQYYSFLKCREFYNNANCDFELKKEGANTFPIPRIYYGAPGTGKTRFVQEEIYKEFPDDNRVFTTFHQSYSYEDFVEGLKPVLIKSKSQNNNDQEETTDATGDVKYRIEEGIFKIACEKAAKLAGYDSLATCISDTKENRASNFKQAIDDNKTMLLCIDEINRGNVASIFGDLISLIEPSKRLGAEYEMFATLPYSKTKFGVPANLLIVGTMNTADRSIQLLDSALRRRFEFVELLPNYDVIENEVAVTILKNINNRIKCLLSKDNQIGHSYLMHAKTNKEIADAIIKKIIPLLEEYFYNDINKVRFVLNEIEPEPKPEYFYQKDTDTENAYKEYLKIDDSEDNKSFYKLNEDIANLSEEECGKYLEHLKQSEE